MFWGELGFSHKLWRGKMPDAPHRGGGDSGDIWLLFGLGIYFIWWRRISLLTVTLRTLEGKLILSPSSFVAY